VLRSCSGSGPARLPRLGSMDALRGWMGRGFMKSAAGGFMGGGGAVGVGFRAPPDAWMGERSGRWLAVERFAIAVRGLQHVNVATGEAVHQAIGLAAEAVHELLIPTVHHAAIRHADQQRAVAFVQTGDTVGGGQFQQVAAQGHDALSANADSDGGLYANGFGVAAVLWDGAGGQGRVGFNGVTPVARQALPAAATDLPTAITLLNAVRLAHITNGLCI